MSFKKNEMWHLENLEPVFGTKLKKENEHKKTLFYGKLIIHSFVKNNWTEKDNLLISNIDILLKCFITSNLELNFQFKIVN